MKVFLPCVHPYTLKDGLILVSDSHITANVIMITSRCVRCVCVWWGVGGGGGRMLLRL